MFAIVKNWKLLNYLLIGDWIMKLWYIDFQKYYSGIKKNGPLIHGATKMNLSIIKLCGRNKKEYFIANL